MRHYLRLLSASLLLLAPVFAQTASRPVSESRPASRPVLTEREIEVDRVLDEHQSASLFATFSEVLVKNVTDWQVGLMAVALERTKDGGLYEGRDLSEWQVRFKAFRDDLDVFVQKVRPTDESSRRLAGLTSDEIAAYFLRYGEDLGGDFRALPTRQMHVEIRGRLYDLTAVFSQRSVCYVGPVAAEPRGAEFDIRHVDVFGQPVPELEGIKTTTTIRTPPTKRGTILTARRFMAFKDEVRALPRQANLASYTVEPAPFGEETADIRLKHLRSVVKAAR